MLSASSLRRDILVSWVGGNGDIGTKKDLKHYPFLQPEKFYRHSISLIMK